MLTKHWLSRTVLAGWGVGGVSSLLRVSAHGVHQLLHTAVSVVILDIHEPSCYKTGKRSEKEKRRAQFSGNSKLTSCICDGLSSLSAGLDWTQSGRLGDISGSVCGSAD